MNVILFLPAVVRPRLTADGDPLLTKPLPQRAGPPAAGHGSGSSDP